MPTAAGEQPSTRVSRNHQDHDRASSKKRRKQDQRQFPVYRKAYRRDIQTDKNEHENVKKREDKLLEEVSDCLKLCSRQRLRAVHMSMRQYGNEASGKDVIKLLQNNGVEIQEGLLQAMCERFEVRNGIVQLESLYKYLVEAHSKTDRDSVVAERTRNTILPLSDFRPDDVDEDLIWRIQDLLVKSRKYIDIPTLRTAFKVKGNRESTTVDVGVARQICLDNDMPVYGALLTNLMKRCGAEKSEKINYQEFLSFLEKGQECALNICPDLKDLSETEKKHTPIEPNILDELSSRTKSTLMSKLMKKASIKRQETKDVKTAETVPVVLKDKMSSDDIGSQDNENFPKSNVIRAEPSLDTDTKEDVKDAVGSTDTRCAQIIIDIIPPSKEPTLNSAESEPFVTNALAHHHVGESVKSTEGIANNNETITRDDLKQNTGDDTYEIAQNAKDRKDVNDDTCNMDHTVDNEDGVDVNDDNMDHRVDNGEGNDTNSNEMEHILFNENEHSGSMEMPTNNTDDEGNNIVKHEIDANDSNGAHETVELTKDVDGGGKDSDLSEQSLNMQWVYGYRGNDCRKNIHVLASGEIVYFMSYVAVIYNKDTHIQRHYTEHTDEIKCIDVDSNGVTMATGQFGSRKDTSIQAHVRIWNGESLQTMNVLGMGEFDKSVACLAFSPGKNILAAVDNSPGKKLMVWDTVAGEKQGEATLHTELICDIGICKKDPDTIIAVGKDHISWWKIDQENKSLQKAVEPYYQDYPQAKFVICMTFTEDGDVITGDSNGSIYVWDQVDHKISNLVKHAHDGPVFTLICRKGYLLSGGRDGIIHCWNLKTNLEAAGFLQLTESSGGIRMLQTLGNDLIVGTTMNSLHLASLMDGPDDLPLSGAVIDSRPITQGHYDDLQGLVVIRNPTDYNVLTAGQDGIICAFDTNNCKAVSRKYMKGHQYMCIVEDDTGQLIALGTKDGCVHILQLGTLGKWKELFFQKLCKERLTVICISPDRKYIAAGSSNSNIYLLSSISDIWEYHGSLEGHQGAIASLEWVKSEEHETFLLQSISSRLERTYWNPLTMAIVPEVHPTTQPDIAWIRKLLDEESVEIQATDVSPDRNLIAIADTNGRLHVGRNKLDGDSNGRIHLGCNGPEQFCSYRTPTGVRVLRFASDGHHLFTAGGRDSGLIQWKINRGSYTSGHFI